MFALLGHPRLAAFNVASVAIWIAAALVNRRGRSTLAMWLLTAEVVAHAVLAVLTLGWASGFQYYLFPLIPFVMFNDRLASRDGRRRSRRGCSRRCSRCARSRPTASSDGALAPSLLRYGNLAIPLLALALVSFYFRRASTSAERRMESMALTDPLTGLLNRRSMEQRLREAAHGLPAHGPRVQRRDGRRRSLQADQRRARPRGRRPRAARRGGVARASGCAPTTPSRAGAARSSCCCCPRPISTSPATSPTGCARRRRRGLRDERRPRPERHADLRRRGLRPPDARRRLPEEGGRGALRRQGGRANRVVSTPPAA